MNGKIITFEGIDGSGKTTLGMRLHQYFTEIGKEVYLTNEPWGISEVHPDPFVATLQLVMNRRHHCNALRAAKYDIALIDRFDLSTKAYQGYGDGVDLDLIDSLNDIATERIDLSLRIWLDVPVDIAVKRLEKQGETVNAAEIARLKRVHAGYAELAEEGWMVRIDATQPPDDVLRESIALIEEVLQ